MIAEYYFKNNILILTEYSNLFRQLHPFTFDQKNNTLLNLKQTCILGYAVSLTFLFLWMWLILFYFYRPILVFLGYQGGVSLVNLEDKQVSFNI
jgi:hypothetical protein